MGKVEGSLLKGDTVLADLDGQTDSEITLKSKSGEVGCSRCDQGRVCLFPTAPPLCRRSFY